MCFCIGLNYQNSWSDHFKHIILFHTSLHTFCYSLEIDQQNQYQSKSNAYRQMGLPVRQGEPISFENLPTQTRPSTLPSLIPPIQNKTSPPITTANLAHHGVQNPYITYQKRSLESTLDRRPDLASIVLGRPTQTNPTPLTTTPNHHGSNSRKKHRRCAYRDRLEFDCSLEIGTTTDTNEHSAAQESPTLTDCLDGDTVGRWSSYSMFSQFK
jgi:hypothetical protein